MKKTILFNILFLIIFLLIIEFGLKYFYSHKLKISNHASINKSKILTSLKDKYTKKYGESIYNPIPTKYMFKDTKELLDFDFRDVDYEHLYPPTYFTNRENKTFHIIKKIKGSNLEIYNVNYVFNKDGFRANTNVRNIQNDFHDTNIFAIGDSFTFGEGVNQGLDYPSQLQEKLNSNFLVYNFGIQGSGPNTFLYRSSNENFFKNVPKANENIFIWFLIPQQFLRFNINLKTYFSQVQAKENLAFESHDYQYNLESKLYTDRGLLKDTHPIYYQLFDPISKVATLNFLNFGPNSYIDEDSSIHFFGLINQGISNCQCKVTKKYVVLLGLGDSPPAALMNSAAAAGFDIINFDDLRNSRPDLNYNIPIDHHPTAEAYWLLTEALKNKLLKK